MYTHTSEGEEEEGEEGVAGVTLLSTHERKREEEREVQVFFLFALRRRRAAKCVAKHAKISFSLALHDHYIAVYDIPCIVRACKEICGRCERILIFLSCSMSLYDVPLLSLLLLIHLTFSLDR